MHDRAALILIFGVPLFAFAVLTAVFSHPVIHGLGIVVVDADRSETSRAFVEKVAASPISASSNAPGTSLPRRERSVPEMPLPQCTSRPISSATSRPSDARK
jgi:hypothetical protein